MDASPRYRTGLKIVLWLLIALATLVALVAIFYAEENWRGKHAWENTKAALEAKGAVLDWNKYIPPPVPDDQNFFAAPKMQEWFVRNPSASTNDLTERLENPDTYATNLNAAAAAKFLAWSDQFQPDFDLIRQALKRPYARMAGDYAEPLLIPIPSFVAVRSVAQVMAQRARCHRTLHQPDEALKDVTFLHDLCRLLEGAPTRKPMTMVAAMINVAVIGLYADAVADGIRQRAWQEPQLIILQQQLKQTNPISLVGEALNEEAASSCQVLKNLLRKYSNDPSFWQKVNHFGFNFWDWVPRGWIYQNMVNVARLELKPLDGVDSKNGTISPQVFNDAARSLDKFAEHNSPYKFLAVIAIPHFNKAWRFAAHTQALVNEAQIACALERYRLANGHYPETLDALTPRFMEKIPLDLVGGQPLHYRLSTDGKFLLYSVGWNETDDGGSVVKDKSGSVDITQGDWVWQN